MSDALRAVSTDYIKHHRSLLTIYRAFNSHFDVEARLEIPDGYFSVSYMLLSLQEGCR